MQETKTQIQDYFNHQVTDLLKLEKQIHRKQKRKNVHEGRIVGRRILSILGHFHVGKDKELQKLMKRLGKVRDLDVGIKNARHYGLEDKTLRKEREGLSIKKNCKKLKTELLAAKKLLMKKLGKGPLTTQKADQSLKTLLKRGLTNKNLHQIRIKLKEIRYLRESMGKGVVHLKKLQDELGKIHDLDVLEGKLGTTTGIKKDKKGLYQGARRTIRGVLNQKKA